VADAAAVDVAAAGCAAAARAAAVGCVAAECRRAEHAAAVVEGSILAARTFRAAEWAVAECSGRASHSDQTHCLELESEGQGVLAESDVLAAQAASADPVAYSSPAWRNGPAVQAELAASADPAVLVASVASVESVELVASAESAGPDDRVVQVAQIVREPVAATT
jgi:hypothetical protein